MASPSWTTFLSYCALLASLPTSHGLIGYGIPMYNPSCAFACRSAIASFPLICSSTEGGHGGHHGGSSATTPECRAGDTSYLQTLAWCINEQCAPFNVEPWRLQKYWEDKATGDVEVIPKWTYSEAFHSVTAAPVEMVEHDGTLNFTAKVDEESWAAEKVSMEYFEDQEKLHSRYGLVILIVGFSIPIACSLLGYLPYTSRLLDTLNNRITYPSSIGTYSSKPLPFLLGYAPTIGQGAYIFFFFALNLVLICVSYKSAQPNTWFESRYNEILAYVANRTGVIAFALSPLLILFSGRNNILLYVTNWSHNTFLLLHRWIAYVFALQCVIHSIAELIAYFPDHATESAKPYWIWGIVATLSVVLMLFLSTLYTRRASYELFLISHVILAVFVLVGSWYHIEFLFSRKWGYQYWLYAAFGVWFFDRLIRVLRIWKTGFQRAVVREVAPAGDDGANGESYGAIVRIDIPNVRWGTEPGKHAYISFPSISARPWENHPFSIVPTVLLTRPVKHNSHPLTRPSTPVIAASSSSQSGVDDIEKAPAASSAPYTHTREVDSLETSNADADARPTSKCCQNTSSNPTDTTTANKTGITLFIRKSTGLTARLHTCPSFPTLLEGPYHSSHSAAILSADRLIVITGGIGITGVFSFLHSHLNAKLYWSCREHTRPLVDEFDGALGGTTSATSKESEAAVEGGLAAAASGGYNFQKEILVGGRFNVRDLVELEAAALASTAAAATAASRRNGKGRGRLGVVVCGPAGMCDDVRDAVVRSGRSKGKGRDGVVIELCVEAFAW